MKHVFLYAMLGLLFLTSGCVTEEGPKMKLAMGVPDGTLEYQTVSPRNLSLKMISKPTVYAGEKTNLIFSLSNDGFREVSIPEWYSHEQDNVIVYAQPWTTEMTQPHPDGWIELSFDLRKPVMHYPLKLLPGNKVLIAKELPFVEQLQVSPGKKRRYFIKSKLNLKSLKLGSDTVVLEVLPRKKSGEK